METIAKVAAAMQSLLTTTAEAAARTTRCIRRQGKLTGATFVQTLVFGWLANPRASLSELCQTAATRGVAITPQGLDQRFTPSAAACLKQVLEATVGEVISADPVALPLLDRFAGVYVQDSTTIALPDALAEEWRGCDGRTAHGAAAALKAQVRLELRGGTLHGPVLSAGRTHDQAGAPTPADLPAGALLLTDLGYFSLARLAAYAAVGILWVTRLKVDTVVCAAMGRRGTVGTVLALAADQATLDVPVTLGGTQHLPARLVAVRVPTTVAAERRRKLHVEARRKGQTVSQGRLAVADWSYYVTNVPVEQLTLREVLVLTRVRWQIELVFKRWKSLGQVDTWRSAKPWRILCEVYAKLIGLVLQHWVMLTGAWANVNRSLWQATTTVQAHALHLAASLDAPNRLTTALTTIAFALATGCRMNTRNHHPNTYQLLADETLAA